MTENWGKWHLCNLNNQSNGYIYVTGVESSIPSLNHHHSLCITLEPCNDKVSVVAAKSLFDPDGNVLPNCKCPVCGKEVKAHAIDIQTAALAGVTITIIASYAIATPYPVHKDHSSSDAIQMDKAAVFDLKCKVERGQEKEIELKTTQSWIKSISLSNINNRGVLSMQILVEPGCPSLEEVTKYFSKFGLPEEEVRPYGVTTRDPKYMQMLLHAISHNTFPKEEFTIMREAIIAGQGK